MGGEVEGQDLVVLERLAHAHLGAVGAEQVLARELLHCQFLVVGGYRDFGERSKTFDFVIIDANVKQQLCQE